MEQFQDSQHTAVGHTERTGIVRVSSIEENVMKQVRRIHTTRRFMNKTAYKIYTAVALLGLLLSTVSVENIYANMPSPMQPASLLQFFYKALLDTELTVQLMFLSLFAIGVLFVRDVLEKGTATPRNLFAQV